MSGWLLAKSDNLLLQQLAVTNFRAAKKPLIEWRQVYYRVRLLDSKTEAIFHCPANQKINSILVGDNFYGKFFHTGRFSNL
jgi:hypothetical protein